MFSNELSTRNLDILLRIDTHLIEKKEVELHFICMHHVHIGIECKIERRIYELSYSIIGLYTFITFTPCNSEAAIVALFSLSLANHQLLKIPNYKN